MQRPSRQEIQTAVRSTYASIADGAARGGCCGGGSCGDNGGTAPADIGYRAEDIGSVVAGADLVLGCGNPQAIARLQPGERVLDLGSGAGFDALLAARQVGADGHVIGVDLTPEMVARAASNAAKAGIAGVEFRVGDIEALPVNDASIDVIMSNCVTNLVPDKGAAFREAFRVLVPGGRLAFADMVATDDLPDALTGDPSAYAGCMAGAARVSDLERLLTEAGFVDLRISVQANSEGWLGDQGAKLTPLVASALIEAVKRDARAAPSPAPSAATAAACCDSGKQAVCCAPSEKSSCCGSAAAPGTCGCQGS